MADGEQASPPAERGRHRHSADDDDGDDALVDAALIAIDDTPTGRHSRVELAAMLAADGRDDADSERSAGGAEPDSPVEPVADVPVGEPEPDGPEPDGSEPDGSEPGEPAAGEPEPAAKPNRAGRNLPAAVGVGVGLAAVVVASLAFRREAFLVLVVVAVTYACVELRHAFRSADVRLPLVPLIVGGAAMDIAAWARGPDGLVVGLLLTFVGIALWRLGDGAQGYARDTGAGMFTALYVPFLAGFAVLMAHPPDGAGRIIAFVLTVVCSDVGGYAVGVLLGRHPMAPMVSPKKSWEGFAGSVGACVIAGSLLFALLFHQDWWIGALYGLAIVATATLGDLGESMLKRGIGIKDMGHLLPGHGGLMDRLDSLLPSAAVAYLFLSSVLG